MFLVRWVLPRPIGFGNYLRVGLRMAKRPKYITTSHAQITEAIVQDGWKVFQSPIWRINTKPFPRRERPGDPKGMGLVSGRSPFRAVLER